MLVLKNIKKAFNNAPILDDVSFSIATGEQVSLIGPGGCGKTTLLKVLLGLTPPDQGAAQVMGQNFYEATTENQEQILRKIGVAFQQGALFDFMTVRENLFFAMENMTNQTIESMDLKVKALLSEVKLARTENMFPYELSGGMKRRVGIVRALCVDPSIAIFDEPTSGLDPVTSTIILNMIHSMSQKTKNQVKPTLVVATSNVEIAIRFADRIIVLHDGKIVGDGPWRELLVSGSKWVQHFLGIRLIGLDLEYAKELDLPQSFINQHWTH